MYDTTTCLACGAYHHVNHFCRDKTGPAENANQFVLEPFKVSRVGRSKFGVLSTLKLGSEVFGIE